MTVNWRASLSTKTIIGMVLVLLLLITSTAVTFVALEQVETVSEVNDRVVMPELNHSSDLKTAILILDANLQKLKQSDMLSKHRAAYALLVKNLTASEQLLKLMNDEMRVALISSSLSQLRDLVAQYNQINTERLHGEINLLMHANQFDESFLTLTLNQLLDSKDRQTIHNFYTNSKALLKHEQRFNKKATRLKVQRLGDELAQKSLELAKFSAKVIDGKTGLIVLQNQVMHHQNVINALDIKATRLMEQLKLDVSYYFASVRNVASNESIRINELSKTARNIIIALMFGAFSAIALFILLFHFKITKRLVLIVESLHSPKELASVSRGKSEVSKIARALTQFTLINEVQKQDLKNQFSQLQELINNSNQAIFVINEQHIIYNNLKASETLEKYNTEQVQSQSLLNWLITDNDKQSAKLHLGKQWFRVVVTSIDWGGLRSELVMLDNITEQVRVEESLIASLSQAKDEAKIDAMTGLYNRRKLSDLLVSDASFSYSMLVIDIDWFKLFNDYYGHAKGDECIKSVASIIDANLRLDNDYAFRYGGEEFVVVLKNQPIEAVLTVAQRILATLHKAQIAHEKSKYRYVSVSIGLAHSTEINPYSWRQVFELADKRLYIAKEKGRNQSIAQDPMYS